jgi:hypothetical protein
LGKSSEEKNRTKNERFNRKRVPLMHFMPILNLAIFVCGSLVESEIKSVHRSVCLCVAMFQKENSIEKTLTHCLFGFGTKNKNFGKRKSKSHYLKDLLISIRTSNQSKKSKRPVSM